MLFSCLLKFDARHASYAIAVIKKKAKKKEAKKKKLCRTKLKKEKKRTKERKKEPIYMEPKYQSAEIAEEPGPIEEMKLAQIPRYPYVLTFEPSVIEVRHVWEERIVRTNKKKNEKKMHLRTKEPKTEEPKC
ncbi:hypothetical protein RhiirB3_467676 [Rhizophagus irregularis]|nr:hypothetical protein RhiirB3_467676 [Rhizophagus irregularis]